MSDLLAPGVRIGDDELYVQLNAQYRNGSVFPTWHAKSADDQDVVLHIFPFRGGKRFRDKAAPLPTWTIMPAAEVAPHFARLKKDYYDPIAALPPISGFVPWSGCSGTQGDDGSSLFILRRPYFTERLTDRFPADATRPPAPALLKLLHQLALTLEALERHYPALDLDLAPGDYLLAGDDPVVVDCGVSLHLRYIDYDMRLPATSRSDHERLVPLAAHYPSLWQLWAATRSPHSAKIPRTDAQFALGALYVYIRTRFLVFEDPAKPCPPPHLPPPEGVMATMEWLSNLGRAVQTYEEHGTLPLAMFPDDAERAMVGRVLARDTTVRYASCMAFVDALAAAFA